jgi:hypothetical protein
MDDVETQTFASSGDAPSSNSWGDYKTARRVVPYGTTCVGAGHRITGGGDNANVVPELIWLGRERDMPPSTNTEYVDLNNTSRYETGSAARGRDPEVVGRSAGPSRSQGNECTDR